MSRLKLGGLIVNNPHRSVERRGGPKLLNPVVTLPRGFRAELWQRSLGESSFYEEGKREQAIGLGRGFLACAGIKQLWSFHGLPVGQRVWIAHVHATSLPEHASRGDEPYLRPRERGLDPGRHQHRI